MFDQDVKYEDNSGFQSSFTLHPPFRHFVPVRLQVIFVGTCYIMIPVIPDRHLQPPSVGKVALDKDQIISEICDPYMISDKSA
jgi:hypothetical protein